MFSQISSCICRGSLVCQSLVMCYQWGRTKPWCVSDTLHVCRWKMASCCRRSSLLFPSSTSTGRLGWSSTSLCLTSFEISWWSESPPLQRARTRTGMSWIGYSLTRDGTVSWRNELGCYCALFCLQIWETWRASGKELPTCQNAVHSACRHAGAEASPQGKWFKGCSLLTRSASLYLSSWLLFRLFFILHFFLRDYLKIPDPLTKQVFSSFERKWNRKDLSAHGEKAACCVVC